MMPSLERLTKNVLTRPGRGGYTLLELLLSLALTVIIVGVIATAIHVNMLSLTRVQASLERKQTARGILGMMQNDIRAGIQYKASDYTGLQDLFTSIKVATNQTPQISMAGVDGELDPTASDQEETEVLVADEDTEESDVPVFIGAANSLSIDISRLPRVDEYHPSIPSLKDQASTVADVKTVSYFVSRSDGVQNQTQRLSLVEPAFSGGLFRRSIDRSVAAYQGLSTTSEPDAYSDLVATEVVELSFRYFDGSNWINEWDSEEENGFPLAVEIFLRIDPARAPGSGVANDGSAPTTDAMDLEAYRVVVQIPVAEIIEPEDDDGS